jgi:hypothetical protein
MNSTLGFMMLPDLIGHKEISVLDVEFFEYYVFWSYHS